MSLLVVGQCIVIDCQIEEEIATFHATMIVGIIGPVVETSGDGTVIGG